MSPTHRKRIQTLIQNAVNQAEIRKCNEIALEISMNEYIEIAKEYSSDKSYVFVNGVLNRVVNDLKAKNQLFKLIKR